MMQRSSHCYGRGSSVQRTAERVGSPYCASLRVQRRVAAAGATEALRLPPSERSRWPLQVTARLWSFTPKFPLFRAEKLLSYQSFESVLELMSTATVIAFAWEPFRELALRGCNRASFLVEVSPEAYDAFFNAPVGLRGQYALSPMHGEAATRRLLSAFESRLIAFAGSAVSRPDVHRSLCAPEAKIWIHESEVQSQLGGADPDILYPMWEKCSESGAGVLAPFGRKLEIMGGWLNTSGQVVSNPAKARRSSEIHECGFS